MEQHHFSDHQLQHLVVDLVRVKSLAVDLVDLVVVENKVELVDQQLEDHSQELLDHHQQVVGVTLVDQVYHHPPSQVVEEAVVPVLLV